MNQFIISRKLKRNQGRRGYRPKQADAKAHARKNKSKVRISQEQWLQLDWSPQQMHDQLQILHEWTISHEWIDQHVLEDKQMGGSLYQYLRCQKKRHKRYE